MKVMVLVKATKDSEAGVMPSQQLLAEMMQYNEETTILHEDPDLEVRTMKYMLLIYMTRDAMTEAERQDCYVESTELCHDLQAKGKFLGANPLDPTASPISVRVRDGKSLVTDGPFVETREQLGGYFLVEARDREEAVAIAARIPGARKGTVEVRPVLEIPGLPGGAHGQ